MTRDLLVTWPLLWAATSACLCLGQNVCIVNWSMVSGNAILREIEIAFMSAMALRQRKSSSRSQPA